MKRLLICSLVLLGALGVAAEDEVVDLKMEKMEDGRLKLEFDAHGRKHKMHLRESRKQLTDIPLHLVGMEADEFSEEMEEIRSIKMMRDRRYAATVAVKFDPNDEGQPIVQSGVFQLGNHEFSISPETHTTARVSKNPLEKSKRHRQAYRVVESAVSRQKRSTPVVVININVTVEVVFIIDCAMWQMFYTLQDLLLYFGHIAEMMNVAYGNMQNADLAISVDLAGIIVLTNKTMLPELIEDFKFPISEEPFYGVDGFPALERLSLWLEGSGPSTLPLPPYDHVMLFSGYDLRDGGNDILGIAWNDGICTMNESASIVEGLGLMSEIAHTATHELGHSLGAEHDGIGTAEGCPDENYIMAASAGSMSFLINRFLFSCCSQRSFYHLLLFSSATCLNKTEAMPNFDDSYIDDQVQMFLPGEIYSLDDQCQKALGTNACGLQTDVCLVVKCIDPNDPGQCIILFTAAVDGTPCDTDKWCIQGACVSDSVYNNTAADLNCDVRDCYGNERKCKNGENKLELRLQCYNASKYCDGEDDCSCGSDEGGCGNSPPCGGNIFGSSGTIESPNKRDNYANNADCCWNITVPDWKVINVSFPNQVMLEDDETCSFDSLQFDGAPSGTADDKLCGVIPAGTEIISAANMMKITFLSDNSIRFPKWSLDWICQCRSTDAARARSCDTGTRIKCSRVTVNDCDTCLEIRQRCCNRCEVLSPTTAVLTTTTPFACVDTDPSFCATIAADCIPFPADSTSRSRCRRKCRNNFWRCCDTCCQIDPDMAGCP